MAALAARPDRSRDLRILSGAIPGINRLAPDELQPTARVTGLFMQPACALDARAGFGTCPSRSPVSSTI